MLSVLFFFFIVVPFSLNSLCFCQDHLTLLYLPHKLTFITHLQHTLKVPMNDHHGMARPRFLLMTLMNGLICNTSKPRQLMKTRNNSKEVSHNLNITQFKQQELAESYFIQRHYYAFILLKRDCLATL